MESFDILCTETGRIVGTVAPIMTEDGSTALVCTMGTNTRTFALGALDSVHAAMVPVMAWVETLSRLDG